MTNVPEENKLTDAERAYRFSDSELVASYGEAYLNWRSSPRMESSRKKEQAYHDELVRRLEERLQNPDPIPEPYKHEILHEDEDPTISWLRRMGDIFDEIHLTLKINEP